MVQKRKDRIEFLVPQDKVEMGIVDLSESGVAILHPTSASPNSAANITVNGLNLIAKVIWCKEDVSAFKIGMQFLDLAPEKAAILKGLVDQFSRGKPLEMQISF